jgi:Fe-S cluster assembly protein SufD
MNPVARWQERFRPAGAEREPAWLDALRRKAMTHLSETGFPSTRVEAWKYTNPAPLLRVPWEAAPEATIGRDDLERLSFPVFACSVIVFVNGRFAPELSTASGLRPHLGVSPLARELEGDGEAVTGLGELSAGAEGGFADLNLAFFSDGACVRIPAGEVHEIPIHLVFVNAPGGTSAATHPRVWLHAGPGSQATVIEDHVSLAGGTSLTNAVSEVHVAEDARVDWIKVQREDPGAFHVSGLHARVERSGRLRAHTFSFGTALTRNDVRVTLAEEGAECELRGLFVAGGDQHVDNHTWVDHARPHGTSRELYKGILDGRARGVFNGRVLVRQDAQKSDARQQNPNLLLSRDAEVNTQPQLEIHADDVKCSHGSTVGQLDPDALFYLRSRGISLDPARALLMRGFVSEIARAVPVPALAERMEDLAVERLGLGRPLPEDAA